MSVRLVLFFAIAACIASGHAADVEPSDAVSANATPAFSIDFFKISSGGQTLSNSCYRLSGTLGEAAPGYSSNDTYSVKAGFWAAAPDKGVDDLFFDGFQGC